MPHAALRGGGTGCPSPCGTPPIPLRTAQTQGKQLGVGVAGLQSSSPGPPVHPPLAHLPGPVVVWDVTRRIRRGGKGNRCCPATRVTVDDSPMGPNDRPHQALGSRMRASIVQEMLQTPEPIPELDPGLWGRRTASQPPSAWAMRGRQPGPPPERVLLPVQGSISLASTPPWT